ncbi:MAG: PEPxxWA-CTERM sorting domain-containing protein [Pseudomonadota bacterium]
MKIAKLAIAGAVAALSVPASAAVTITQFGSTSLGAFSYSVVGTTITINETWSNANNVFLRISGLTSQYTVIKNIVNNSGVAWTSIANELLDPTGDGDDGSDPALQPAFVPAGWSTSNDNDGLSFAQGGGIARTSSLFPTVVADEFTDARDFLDFLGATANPGANFSIQFGLDPLANGGDVLLSQRVNTRSAVPEPTTWAMLLFGFGAIGAAMRRQSKVVRVSFN